VKSYLKFPFAPSVLTGFKEMIPEDNCSLINLGNGRKLRPLNPLDLNMSSYKGVSPLYILL
jgi:hypothetical protein